MPYATTTCTRLDATTTECVARISTTTPILVQDAGNVSFGLALIFGVLFLAVVAFVFNSWGGGKRR